MTQSQTKRKASTSVPVQSEPPAGKHAPSHVLYSMPIVLDDYDQPEIPPFHDPNRILGDMTRHMSGMSLSSIGSPANNSFYRLSFTSSICTPQSARSNRSAMISERTSSTAAQSERSSMPTSDIMGDDTVPTPRRAVIPKDERPAQPDEERDFYEKMWMINFQQSTVQTTAMPDTVYIPPGEQGQLVRISGHSLASGANPQKQSSSSRPYVVFRLEVECQANSKRWTVYRRYHDFKELASQLKSYRLPSLPSKRLSLRRSFDMAFLRKRQNDLESWLKLVLAMPPVPHGSNGHASCPSMTECVRVFLTKDANQPPALETGTRGFSYNEPELQAASLFTASALQITPPVSSHSRSHSSSSSTANLLTRTMAGDTRAGGRKSRLASLFLSNTEPAKPKRKTTFGRSNSDKSLDLLYKAPAPSQSASAAFSSRIASAMSMSQPGPQRHNDRHPSQNYPQQQEPFQQQQQQFPRPPLKYVEEPYKPSARDFEPLRFIGQGSFGRVLLVRKKYQNELYAMKILSKQSVLQKEQVEHTRTERNVLGSIDHPFIVRLHYAFQTTKQLYFVLDYCPGGDLFFHLSRVGCFPEAIARFYAAEISLALVHLHEHGIVYRDLKPENIMLDVDGHVKLADFGLAKQGISNRVQGTNTLCGTPEYLPPEILNKAGHGNAVDWWNLGMVLYELLTGRPPWYTTDREELYRRLRSSPLEFPPGLSPQAMDLIAGLLERDPAQRLRAAQVLTHPFFHGIHWDRLLNREIEPAFRPCQFSDPLDAVNFEDDFTRMPVHMAMDELLDPKTPKRESMTPKSSMAGRVSSVRTMSYTFQGFTFDGETELDQGSASMLLTTPPSL
ncbi:unnamed protein product [Aphanomyces euteiches]|uniref:AGC protein kinase n=1 Tax=Aphanomyces euteiches TaxID=100861 RepID=A0A6G0WK37_9STRA|nr:hypothetical protein Ae201684_014411 [Aphanomyces euteiches]KAH9088773.1 hypothetical protein Ae201684P_012987 [Aphanomyces euteiches]KAH9158175.1 hypothetical protein AeRB84_000008 [Aphanomyces euteiches]